MTDTLDRIHAHVCQCLAVYEITVERIPRIVGIGARRGPRSSVSAWGGGLVPPRDELLAVETATPGDTAPAAPIARGLLSLGFEPQRALHSQGGAR